MRSTSSSSSLWACCGPLRLDFCMLENPSWARPRPRKGLGGPGYCKTYHLGCIFVVFIEIRWFLLPNAVKTETGPKTLGFSNLLGPHPVRSAPPSQEPPAGSLSLSLSLSLSSRPSGEQCPMPVFRRPCLFSSVCCSLGAPQGAPSRVLAVQVCRLWRPHRGHQWRHRPHRMCLGWATLRYHLHLTFGLPGVAISVARNGLLRYIINGYVVENHV